MTATTMILATVVQQPPDFRDPPGQHFSSTTTSNTNNNSSSSSNSNNHTNGSIMSSQQPQHTTSSSCPLFQQQQQQQTRQTSFTSWYTSSDDDDDDDDEGIQSAIQRSLSNLSECVGGGDEQQQAQGSTELSCRSLSSLQRPRASSYDNLLEFQDSSDRMVRFSKDPPQVFSYEQPSLQYYCHLYYGAHEMQELINEYMKEQQQQQQQEQQPSDDDCESNSNNNNNNNKKEKQEEQVEELAETSTSSSSWEDVTESCCSSSSTNSTTRGTIRFSQEPDQVHEYEKPETDEYTLLYYTSDEVDQMIDDYYLKEWVYCPKEVECPSNTLQAATLQQPGTKAD